MVDPVNIDITKVEGTSVLSTGESGGTKFLREDGDGTCSWQTPSGAGDVSGPGGAVTDNTIVRWDGIGGTSVQGSGVAIDDSDGISGATIDGDNNTISNLDIGIEVDWAAADDVTTASAFESGDKVLIYEAGVGIRKVDYDDLPGGGGISNVVEDTTPQLGGQLDVNGNAIGDGTLELLKFSETLSAVNEITVTNAATGNAPSLSATGDDTDINLELTAKGTGNVTAGGNRVLTTSDTGSTVQAYDAGLVDIAGLAVTDGNIIVGDGSNWVAESGSTARASLGLTIGTDVQAYDANLTTWAGVTPGTGVATALAVNIGSAGAPVLFNGDAGTPSALVGTNITGTAAGLTVGATTGVEAGADVTDATNVAAAGALMTSSLGTGVETALGVNIGSAGAPVVLNGAGGTPSSITLTNGTGLPVAGITASTSTALGVGSIELGHASDTTLSRSAAGVLAVEGVNVRLVTDEISLYAFALGDETTPITTGQKVSIYVGKDIVLTRIYLSCVTTPSTTTVQVDCEDGGTTLLNAVLSIATSAFTAETSTFAGAASSYALSKGDLLTVDCDQADAAGAGFKIEFFGYYA